MVGSRRFGALCAFLLCLTVGIADARENMAERAKSIRQRQSDMAAAKYGRMQRRADNTTSFRYHSNQTDPYLVKSLPDINYDLGEMYAGQIAVNESDPSRKMFFIYQPTVSEPVDEVTIWFNGGPGCSSLEGFLQENGLFIWGWGQYSATINPYSWVNLTNVLWVEYPIGVGFSTGNVTANTEEETAQDFLGFFKNFQKTFGIKNYKIYVTGESYAGRYVPYVSAAMVDAKDPEYYNISGALMYDPVIGQFEYVGSATVAVPFVDAHPDFFNLNATYLESLREAHQACGYADFINKYYAFPPSGIQPAFDTSFNNASNLTVDCDVWNNAQAAAFQPNPCFNPYEANLMCPILSDPLGFPSDLLYLYPGMSQAYFNRSDVKAAIHAPDNVDWAECTGPVFVGEGGQYGLGDFSADPIQHVLPQVIEATGRVLVSNGDFDYEIITNGTLLAIQNMTWGGMLGFQSKPNTSIVIELPDLQYEQVFVDSGLGGYDGPGQGIMGIQHFERGLMWAETFQSGHMQPQFQPRSSYRHLQWVLGRIDTL